MRGLLSILLLLIVSQTMAQPIGAFIDYDHKFYVLDDEQFRQVEFQKVQSYAIGTKCVSYTDNGGWLKAYSNHIRYDVSPAVDEYWQTDHLLAFRIGQLLFAFVNGNKYAVASFASHYSVGDSVIAYVDDVHRLFNVFYNERQIQLEDLNIEDDLLYFKSGSNLVAYVDAYNTFKIFYQNKIYSLLKTDDAIPVEVGQNVAAFYDPDGEQFYLFHRGKTRVLEKMPPVEVKAGHDMVAYVNALENFMVFDGDSLYEVLGYAPDFFEIKRRMLVYGSHNQFFLVENGRTQLIENYIPLQYSINGNNLVYINQNGNLVMWRNGQTQVLSYSNINSFFTIGDMVIFNEGINTTKIYISGKIYKR